MGNIVSIVITYYKWGIVLQFESPYSLFKIIISVAHILKLELHFLSIPKFLHILHTSTAFSSPSLQSWDHLLKSIVSKIININLS